jgi:hypothetical protein
MNFAGVSAGGSRFAVSSARNSKDWTSFKTCWRRQATYKVKFFFFFPSGEGVGEGEGGVGFVSSPLAIR